MQENRLARSVQRLSSAILRIERHVAGKHEFSVPQYRLLMCLLDQQNASDVRMGDLAEDQGVAISTMTRNVTLLERKGLLSKATGFKDKRTVCVCLSDLGQQSAKDLKVDTELFFRKAFGEFHPSDRLERSVALERVSRALEQTQTNWMTK
ncbi:MAG: MarR family transcriptional regulator [Myxococcota bacterium]|jgi:DNA-binding MarR family transcriptional regulator|nr:MarR family transcriptional regulator [Myxococcota bacterium]